MNCSVRDTLALRDEDRRLNLLFYFDHVGLLLCKVRDGTSDVITTFCGLFGQRGDAENGDSMEAKHDRTPLACRLSVSVFVSHHFFLVVGLLSYRTAMRGNIGYLVTIIGWAADLRGFGVGAGLGGVGTAVEPAGAYAAVAVFTP